MEEQEIFEEDIQPAQPYQPRPKWQRMLAWIAVAVIVAGFLLYCYQIANGGF